jgi:ElaB/YqjD/DUF883 family membrane-anchored ribosome-binding protein
MPNGVELRHDASRPRAPRPPDCPQLPTTKDDAMKNRQDTGTTAETPEQLIEHISRLMAEAEAMLAGPHTEQASGKLANIKERLESARDQLTNAYGRARDGIADAYDRARRSATAGAKYTDETIREYPYQSLAVALGVGVLIGALIGRRSNNQ